jgi:hypothetical protein
MKSGTPSRLLRRLALPYAVAILLLGTLAAIVIFPYEGAAADWTVWGAWPAEN